MKVRIATACECAPCETAPGHADNMRDIARQLRAELRTMIRHYRLCRTAREICEIKEIYLQAEDQIRLDYIKRLLRLYREAQRDCAAMRRVGKR